MRFLLGSSLRCIETRLFPALAQLETHVPSLLDDIKSLPADGGSVTPKGAFINKLQAKLADVDMDRSTEHILPRKQ
jgi:hypothetical protein